VGLKRSPEEIADGDTFGANRTKVGLKQFLSGDSETGESCANRTKVGLKQRRKLQLEGDGYGANRTKVGLKREEGDETMKAEKVC